jgi:hypothetical protein
MKTIRVIAILGTILYFAKGGVIDSMFGTALVSATIALCIIGE